MELQSAGRTDNSSFDKPRSGQRMSDLRMCFCNFKQEDEMLGKN